MKNFKNVVRQKLLKHGVNNEYTIFCYSLHKERMYFFHCTTSASIPEKKISLGVCGATRVPPSG